MNFALFLTLSRLVLCPIFVVFYLYSSFFGLDAISLPYSLLSVLILCELTDIFDGHVARRSSGVTQLGKILDLMADSIVRTSMLLTLTQRLVALPIWVVLIFIYRDCVISTLRTLCALQGEALSARTSGKIKAILQAVVLFLIVILMIPLSLGYIKLQDFQMVSFLSVLATALYSVGSGIEYIWANRSAVISSYRNRK